MATLAAAPMKTLYKNGWITGVLVAAAVCIAFLALFREAYRPFDVVLVVGLPIGIAAGVFAGLFVEGRAIPRETRYKIGLATLASLLLYVILLCGFLSYLTG